MNDAVDIAPKKTLYTLDLHESVRLGGLEVTRVPGGWVYSWALGDVKKGIGMAMVFVPFNDEFAYGKGQTVSYGDVEAEPDA